MEIWCYSKRPSRKVVIGDYGSNYSGNSNSKGDTTSSSSSKGNRNSITVIAAKCRREVLRAPFLTVVARAGVALLVAVAMGMTSAVIKVTIILASDLAVAAVSIA